jgi:hypothetical protein
METPRSTQSISTKWRQQKSSKKNIKATCARTPYIHSHDSLFFLLVSARNITNMDVDNANISYKKFCSGEVSLHVILKEIQDDRKVEQPIPDTFSICQKNILH